MRKRKEKRGLLELERRIERLVPQFPTVVAKRAKGKQAFRLYWPDHYQPKKRDGWQWIPQPLTSGKEIKLPRYMQVGSHGYTRVTPKNLPKVTGWLGKNAFKIRWEDKHGG